MDNIPDQCDAAANSLALGMPVGGVGRVIVQNVRELALSHSFFLYRRPSPMAATVGGQLTQCVGSGLGPDRASNPFRSSGLQSLAWLLELARRWLRGSAPGKPHRGPLSSQHQVVIVGWLLLGIGFASRVCAASEPSHGSIAACVGVSMGSLAMAIMIRRAQIPVRLAIGISLLLSATAAAGLLQVSWHPWIEDSLALSPSALGFLALFGALAGWALTISPRIPSESPSRPG